MKLILAAAASAALLVSTSAFAAGDVGAELTTAGTHAGLAGKATTIDMAHMHLHHALNCLEGSGGADYDSGNANPCAKSGTGAIPDSADAAQKAKLQTAIGQLKGGVAATDLTVATKAGTDASATIASAK